MEHELSYRQKVIDQVSLLYSISQLELFVGMKNLEVTRSLTAQEQANLTMSRSALMAQTLPHKVKFYASLKEPYRCIYKSNFLILRLDNQ